MFEFLFFLVGAIAGLVISLAAESTVSTRLAGNHSSTIKSPSVTLPFSVPESLCTTAQNVSSQRSSADSAVESESEEHVFIGS